MSQTQPHKVNGFLLPYHLSISFEVLSHFSLNISLIWGKEVSGKMDFINTKGIKSAHLARVHKTCFSPNIGQNHQTKLQVLFQHQYTFYNPENFIST